MSNWLSPVTDELKKLFLYQQAIITLLQEQNELLKKYLEQK